MSRPADGLMAALESAGFLDPNDQAHAARVMAAWVADHLDALAEGSAPDEFDRNAVRGWRAASAEVRAVGGVE